MATRKDDDTTTTTTDTTEVKRERHVETSRPGPNPRSETPDEYDKRIQAEQQAKADAARANERNQ